MRWLSLRDPFCIPTLLLLCITIACTSNGENTSGSLNKSKQDHEFVIIGRANLTVEVAIQKNENWSINMQIESDSTSKRWMSIKTPTLDSGITVLLNTLYDVPFELPQSANYAYKKNKFELVEAIEGAQLDTATTRKLLKKAFFKKKMQVNLTEAQAYVQPRYLNDCEEIKAGKKALDKCLKSEVTISGEGKEFKLDHKVFGPWLRLNKTMQVSIDTVAFLAYILPKIGDIEKPLPDLSLIDVERDSAKISESGFLPRINVMKEFTAISQLIFTGKKSNRVVESTNINLLEGIKLGHTDFVEISIDEQKLWLFKHNILVLETAIVTGDLKRGRDTPKGSYAIKYKARNVVLRGRDYAAFVSYWMPFYGGYGLHDANWRRSFGGAIYTRSGSHGCVNMPSKIAPIVFNTIKVGTPVIVR